MKQHKLLRVGAVGAALALTLTACGANGGSGTGTTAPPGDSAAPTDSQSPAGVQAADYNPQPRENLKEGGEAHFPINEIPVWVRPGAVLVLGAEKVGRPDYNMAEGVEVRVYEPEEGRAVEVNVPTGVQKEIAGVGKVNRDGDKVSIEVASGTVGISSIALFTNGKVTRKDVAKGETALTVNLS